MQNIRFLEMHVAHACNFHCMSCSHFAGNGHRGLVQLDEAEEWMQAWHGRLRPEVFDLLGGEPTLHPRLAEFLLLARRYWPHATLHLTTNGFFLHRHPDLPGVLKQTGTILCLTKHNSFYQYMVEYEKIVRMLQEWQDEHQIQVAPRDSESVWRMLYHGHGDAIMPFEDNALRRSWAVCPCKGYFQLFRGRLWKCSMSACLQLQKEAHPAISAKWDRYLAYRPLEANCTELELERFLLAEEEDVCGMCPKEIVYMRKPTPLAPPAASPPSGRRTHAAEGWSTACRTK